MRSVCSLFLIGVFGSVTICLHNVQAQTELLPGPVDQPLQLGKTPTYPKAAATPFQLQSNRLGASNGLLAPEPPQSTLVFKQAQATIDHFGSASAARTLQSLPSRPSFLQSGGGRSVSHAKKKPFNGASNGPTVSPYLNLFRDVNEESAPNYFAFVKPQLQQQRLNRRQQAEIQTLNREVQQVENRSQGNTGLPGTGHGTRYLNTAQYYSGFGL